MRGMARAAVAALVAALPLGGCHDPFTEEAAAAPTPFRLDRTTIRLTTADGKVRAYKVEIARTAEEQARGLMYRRSMPRDAGMLFLFPEPRIASFWMRNTYLPLDIIFISPQGRVLNVAKGEPLNEAPVESVGPAGAVLELNQGEAARIGLKPGDRVNWGKE